ncbi:MAG: hypothetical protein ACI9VN_001450 [Patescibacteria group bacterium]|jgi:hypothetical protein
MSLNNDKHFTLKIMGVLIVCGLLLLWFPELGAVFFVGLCVIMHFRYSVFTHTERTEVVREIRAIAPYSLWPLCD